MHNVTRVLFDESRVHPAIRQKMDDQGRTVIAEVQAAVAAHAIVVVGMALNPFPRAARKWLDAAGIAYHYICYGSYLSDWRKRLSLKLWMGWTTFPMIFIDGEFIGGAEDLKRLGVDAVKQAAGASSKRA
jgi:monothiol glutaredoxin